MDKDEEYLIDVIMPNDNLKEIELLNEESKKLFDECTEITIDENNNKIQIIYLDSNYTPTNKNNYVYKRINRLDNNK